MSSPTANTSSHSNGLLHSVMNSLVTPYWPFNILEIGYLTLGMALAGATYEWDWYLWGVGTAFIWIWSAASNNMDLAASKLTVDVDSRVQYVVGGLMFVLYAAVGVYLATLTSMLFLGLVVLAAFGSLAYNLEWFGGILHDREYKTGIGNLGFTAAWVPTFIGYFLVAQTVNLDLLGAALFAAGPMFVCSAIHYLESDLKELKYEDFGIEHERDVEPDFERLQRRAAVQPNLNIIGMCAMAVGLVIIFVI
ncbi:hypothetical protein [Halorussus lipolyticus]|uniref:hypothetical protein n=1 Tax=Halorussus lipolyticus TaxID=3034024 RepID=UPI0023E757BF|nr:hypothetical protein [Halorussus sp. DT80]